MPNKLTRMAKQLLAIEEDLPMRANHVEGLDATVDAFRMYVFNQVWGSTALGFDNFGCDVMTSAPTYVFVPNDENKQPCIVYFDGQFAYAVPYSQIVMNDIQSCNMASVAMSDKYLL